MVQYIRPRPLPFGPYQVHYLLPLTYSSLYSLELLIASFNTGQRDGQINKRICVISCFRCEVDEICALLGYYAASSGNCLPTFRDNLNVGKKLPLLAV